MNKTERRGLITQLVNDGEDQQDIVREVVAKSGVQEATVQKDISEMYPDGIAGVEGIDGPEGPDGIEGVAGSDEEANVQQVAPVIVERIVEKIVYRNVNPEMEKGRIAVEDYEVPRGEEHIVHAEIERTSFDPNTAKKKSTPKVQKFDDRAWLNFKKQARQQGYIHVKVLHAPEGVDVTIPALVQAPK